MVTGLKVSFHVGHSVCIFYKKKKSRENVIFTNIQNIFEFDVKLENILSDMGPT